MSTRRQGFTCPKCNGDLFTTRFTVADVDKNYRPNTSVGVCSTPGCGFQWVRDNPDAEAKVMHYQQLQEIKHFVQPVKSADIVGVNNLTDGKIPNYQRYKEPTPVAKYFKHCRHFWVANLDMDNRIASPRILEWNPVRKTWHPSGEVATYLPPLINMQGCVILSVVEVPEIPFSFKTQDLK